MNQETTLPRKGDYIVIKNTNPYIGNKYYQIVTDRYYRREADGNPHDGWSPVAYFDAIDRSGQKWKINASTIYTRACIITEAEFKESIPQ
jgi:hypothetical protein